MSPRPLAEIRSDLEATRPYIESPYTGPSGTKYVRPEDARAVLDIADELLAITTTEDERP